jgi:2-desacetyl-2-hydroxyethyl bacteriochlorophyllide A dehydrogenase
VLPVPDGLDPASAALAKILSIALRGVRIAKARPGQSVAVIGLGLIGTLSARLHKHFGAELLALDVSPCRVANASSAGLDALVPKGSIEDEVRERFREGADVVVDATGNPKVLPHSLLAARTKPFLPKPTPSSKLVVQGSYPGDIALPYQEAFMREISILFPRDTTKSDQADSLGLIASGAVDLTDLAAVRVKPEEAPEIYRRLAAPDDLLTAVIDWS